MVTEVGEIEKKLGRIKRRFQWRFNGGLHGTNLNEYIFFFVLSFSSAGLEGKNSKTVIIV